MRGGERGRGGHARWARAPAVQQKRPAASLELPGGLYHGYRTNPKESQNPNCCVGCVELIRHKIFARASKMGKKILYFCDFFGGTHFCITLGRYAKKQICGFFFFADNNTLCRELNVLQICRIRTVSGELCDACCTLTVPVQMQTAPATKTVEMQVAISVYSTHSNPCSGLLLTHPPNPSPLPHPLNIEDASLVHLQPPLHIHLHAGDMSPMQLRSHKGVGHAVGLLDRLLELHIVRKEAFGGAGAGLHPMFSPNCHVMCLA